ncbi:MAG: nuclease-related domain-containing protein [Eubacteriales bacterium]|nr:nuclease-related domain-containing protein [Eubacteriales bacterium]
MEFIYLFAMIALIVLIFLVTRLFKWRYEKHEQREIKSAGNKGEAYFNNMLKSILRDDDVLIRNVCLQKAEIDSLIINNNGIFIVEVKYYNGRLYGDIDDFEWTKEKISPGGNVFYKQVKNPIKQIKRQTYILSQFLKENNIRIWISGYAYFINGNSPVDDESVIYDIDEFDRIIHTTSGKQYDERLINKAIEALTE